LGFIAFLLTSFSEHLPRGPLFTTLPPSPSYPLIPPVCIYLCLEAFKTHVMVIGDGGVLDVPADIDHLNKKN
jgi:hypothetical protein